MANDVPDPSDWLPTPLADFESLENSLRCQVCKEYLNSPMMTSCSHTFCSLCIRRCLAADGLCPLCRAPDQALKLRKNNAMEETVRGFVAARPAALRLGRAAAAASTAMVGRATRNSIGVSQHSDSRRSVGNKRTLGQADLEGTGELSPRKTRAKTRAGSREAATLIVVDDSETEAQETETEPEETPLNDGLVACPICQKRMPEERVFGHIDAGCSDAAPARPPSQVLSLGRTQIASLPTRQPNARQPARPKPKPLPGLNYSILKETALRKKIGDLGIPSYGSKVALQRRHAEWVNLWNANCDASRPRSSQELLRDLDQWERSQNQTPAALARGDVMDKEFDRPGYGRAHGEEFHDLIAKAREGRERKLAEKEKEKEKEREAAGSERKQDRAEEKQGESPAAGELVARGVEIMDTQPDVVQVPDHDRHFDDIELLGETNGT